MLQNEAMQGKTNTFLKQNMFGWILLENYKQLKILLFGLILS